MALPGLLFHGEGAVTADGICCCRPYGRRAATLNRRNAKNVKTIAPTGAALVFCVLTTALGLKGARSPFFATTTTAACGRNREELLGQWTAGCETRPRVEADTGCHNPQHPARRNRWHFSGSLLVSKESISGGNALCKSRKSFPRGRTLPGKPEKHPIKNPPAFLPEDFSVSGNVTAFCRTLSDRRGSPRRSRGAAAPAPPVLPPP